MGLLISETYVDRTTGGVYGETGVYEAFTDNPGVLFRRLRREYGKCDGRVYVDNEEGDPVAVGWVFVKRVEYEDARNRETYLREVWVTLFDKYEERTVVDCDYHAIG